MALAALSAVAFTACSDDDDQYKPGDPSVGVYFEGTGESNVAILPTETQGVLTVYRQGVTAAATYKIKVESESADLFFLHDEISFAEGASTAQYIIGYNAEDLETGVPYTIDLKFADDVPTCAYGVSQTTLILILQKDYTPWETVKQALGQGGRDCTWYFTTTGGVQVAGESRSGLPISVRTNKNDANDMQFMIEDWIYDEDILDPSDYESEEEMDADRSRLYIDFEKNTGNCFVAYDTPTGYLFSGTQFGDAPMCVTDVYTYLTQSPDGPAKYGMTLEEVLADDEYFRSRSFYDETSGMFAMYMVYYFTDGTATQLYGQDYEYCQVSGFTNYNPGLVYEGTMTNANGNAGYALVNYTLDPGVEKLSLIASATQTEEELQELITSESDLCTVIEGDASEVSTGTARVQLDGSGSYTLVAMTYGEDEWHGPYTLTFKTTEGVPENDNIHWPVVGSAYITDGWIAAKYLKTEFESSFWEVPLRQNVDNPGMFRLVSPWTNENCPLLEYNTNKASADIVIDATNPDCVKIYAQYSGFTDNAGVDYYIANFAGTVGGAGMTDEELMNAGTSKIKYNTTFDGTTMEIMPSWYGYSERIENKAANYNVINRNPATTTIMFDISTPVNEAKAKRSKKFNSVQVEKLQRTYSIIKRK